MTNERMGGNQIDQAPKPGESGYEADQDGGGDAQQKQDEAQRPAR